MEDMGNILKMLAIYATWEQIGHGHMDMILYTTLFFVCGGMYFLHSKS
jgi:hypothetical protein